MTIEREHSSPELLAYEATPPAERRFWISMRLAELFDRSVLGLKDLELVARWLTPGERSVRTVRGRELVFAPHRTGCWLVTLTAETKAVELDGFEPSELRELLEQLAWENGGELSNQPNDVEPFCLWQPVWFGGFWRELANYSNAELRARIPSGLLEMELDTWSEVPR